MTSARERMASAVRAICELAAEVSHGSILTHELGRETSWYWCQVLHRAAVIHFAGAMYEWVVEANPPISPRAVTPRPSPEPSGRNQQTDTAPAFPWPKP